MVANLSSWIKQIIMVAMFTLFVDLFMPDNDLRKYIKVILGTIVMIAILNPIISLLNADTFFAGVQLEARGYLDENSISRQAEKLKHKNMEMALELYEKELEERIVRQLRQLTFLEVSKTDVKVEQDGSIKEIHLILKKNFPQPQKNIEKVFINLDLQFSEKGEIKKLKEYLSAFYEIPETNISVEVEGN